MASHIVLLAASPPTMVRCGNRLSLLMRTSHARQCIPVCPCTFWWCNRNPSTSGCRRYYIKAMGCNYSVFMKLYYALLTHFKDAQSSLYSNSQDVLKHHNFLKPVPHLPSSLARPTCMMCVLYVSWPVANGARVTTRSTTRGESMAIFH